MDNVITDAALKNKLIGEHGNKINPADLKSPGVITGADTTKYTYSTELIDLPSKGKMYPSSHPLASGQIEIKYMTAKEEDILASKNLLEKGIVLDKLLQSLIITKFPYNDLLAVDKLAIMYAARVLAYGSDYKIQINCPSCNAKSVEDIDLSKLDDKDIDLDDIPQGTNSFEFELPSSKIKVTFKLLNHADEMAIENELKSLKKLSKITNIDPELSTRLKHVITAVDGNPDPIHISGFVPNMLARDTLALRKEIQRVTPGIDATFLFECPSCAHEDLLHIPVQVNFFWPGAGV